MKTWHWIAIGVGVLVITSQGNRILVMSDLKKIQLSKDFNLAEFVKTSTGIDNIPGDAEIENLRFLVGNVLQPLRDYVKKPIRITSGYRSPAVNAAVGGSSTTSQHMKGQAADFQIDGMTNQQIIDTVRLLRLPYDQIIDEQLRGSKWIHISFSKAGNRKQWLTARDKAGGGTLYQQVKIG